jgi:hypothetical protein
MIAVTAKAKSIDRYIAESPKRPVRGKVDVGGTLTTTAVSSIECWPEPSDDYTTATTTPHNEGEGGDLYGYEDAAPTPRNHKVDTSTPRRSSLKGSDYNLDGSKKPPRRASIGYTGEILTLILPTGETKEKRSSISFAEKDDVRMVEPVASLVKNPRTLWFQAAEYQHILEKVQDVVEHAKAHQHQRSSKKSSSSSSSWICTRGLENVISSRYVEERAEATATVLDENRMQKSHNRYDDEYIRTMYRFHSADSQHRAEETAKKDREEVEEYLKMKMDTTIMGRRMSC